MLVHQEVRIRHASDPDSRILIQVLADFCANAPKRYSYLRKNSLEYQESISRDAVILHRHDRFPFPLLAFASSDGATMQLTNIVPQASSELEMRDYNTFASEFARDLKEFSRSTKTSLKIRCTSALAAGGSSSAM